MKRRYCSFVVEAASSCWGIAQNRIYLWGTHFYWICDCITLKEILECNGNISMVCCWDQKLLGYYFSILHRSEHVMRDIDAISRWFGPLIAFHIFTASLLSNEELSCWLVAYSSSLSSLRRAGTYDPSAGTSSIHIPILTAKRLLSGVLTLPNKLIEEWNPCVLSIHCKVGLNDDDLYHDTIYSQLWYLESIYRNSFIKFILNYLFPLSNYITIIL